MFAFATLKNGTHYVNSCGVAGSGGVLACIAALKEERAGTPAVPEEEWLAANCPKLSAIAARTAEHPACKKVQGRNGD